jgi:hypothetical protein
MYILWWIVAFLMACSYFALEWKLWRAGIERVYENQRVTLYGKRWHYNAIAFAIGFIGPTAVFLGLLDYAGIQLQSPVCWLAGSLVVGGINLVNVGARLKHFDFDGD